MTDPDGATATYSRDFDAPRELVFRCMTDPEHLTRFWGPSGTHTPLDGIVVDARPGGAFETTMVADADGSRHVMRAVFDEVVAPERLAWTEVGSGMRCVSTFVDLGEGRTRVTVEQTNLPAPMRSPQARAGFATSLDRFQDYVRSMQQLRT